MTVQTRAVLKGVFEQGDTPQGSNYEDLIDSALSLADTTAQSISSPILVAGAIAASTTVSANTVEASAGVFTDMRASIVSASSASFDSLLVGGEEILPPSEAVAVGALHITATASFIASAAGAFSIIPGSFSALSTVNQGVSASPTLCEIEYTGTATAKFLATAYFSIKASAVNKLSGFRIGINAVSLSRSQIRRFISSATDIGAAAAGCLVELGPNDRVSLMATNFTDTTGLEITDLIFVVSEQ